MRSGKKSSSRGLYLSSPMDDSVFPLPKRASHIIISTFSSLAHCKHSHIIRFSRNISLGKTYPLPMAHAAGVAVAAAAAALAA